MMWPWRDLEFRKRGICVPQYLAMATHEQRCMELFAEIMSFFVGIVILPIFTPKCKVYKHNEFEWKMFITEVSVSCKTYAVVMD